MDLPFFQPLAAMFILISLVLSTAGVFAATLSPAHMIERRGATNIFPSPPTTVTLSSPIIVKAGQSFTPLQEYTRYERGYGVCRDGEGGQADAVFILEEGAALNRVVIGKNQMEGVHCLGMYLAVSVWVVDTGSGRSAI